MRSQAQALRDVVDAASGGEGDVTEPFEDKLGHFAELLKNTPSPGAALRGAR